MKKYFFLLIALISFSSVNAQSWNTPRTTTIHRIPALSQDSLFGIKATSRADAMLGIGVLSPITASSGMSNPMTTGGDIIYGGASGAATRLANGTALSTLTSNGTTLAPTWSVQPKRYVALLTQSGTDPPVATVLENSLGGTVVWTRDDPGSYSGTLSGAFVTDKTIINGGADHYEFIPFTDDRGSGIQGYYLIKRQSDNVIKVYVMSNTFVEDDFSTITSVKIPIVITVYP